ncbi:MAG: putative ubiE/COQ5 methyltransferase [Phenylobacterium sp.]|nr:putative ubiE/COQ5 methyltransferase [Phenylobacterium sp.]
MGGVGARELEDVLARFPKTRPELPPKLAAIYTRQYLENRAGATPAASLSQRLERWLHRQVAADVKDGAPRSTLELGAGTLNQLAFEPPSEAYDIVEPFEALYRDRPQRARIRDVYADAAEVPAERAYDRITSVAALEHICDLPRVLARAVRHLKPGGSLRAAIPSEGGVLWKLGWMLTTGLEFRLRHGLDYGLMMAHEHVNDAREIETLVGALFEEVEIRSFGVGRQLSLYRFIAARNPRLEVAADWDARFG